jgi:hypothetical protein
MFNSLPLTQAMPPVKSMVLLVEVDNPSKLKIDCLSSLSSSF